MPWPLVAAAGVAGVSSLIGGRQANRNRSAEALKDRQFQSKEAGISRDFTSAEAKRQMDFQQNMRSTEWQVGVEDMKAAGLNPALAYSQGGASSPGGASGSGAAGSGSQARQEDPITPAVSSAMQHMRLNKELEVMDAGIQRTKVDTEVAKGSWRRGLGFALDWFKGGGLGSSARSIAAGMKESFSKMGQANKSADFKNYYDSLRMFYGAGSAESRAPKYPR